MTARPQTRRKAAFRDAGKTALTRDQLDALGTIGLNDDDLHWLGEQVWLFRRANARPEPSPAEIRAALRVGEQSIADLRKWLQDLDAMSRFHLRAAAHATGRAWHELARQLDAKLTELDDLLGVAWQRSPEPSRGRPPSGVKTTLAGLMLERFGDRKRAYDILAIVLPDDGHENLDKLLREARKKLDAN